MPAYGKRKGASFERLIRNHFNALGIEAINPARTGFDGSDIELPGILNLEAKNRKTRSLPAWTRQAERDATTPIYGIVHKRFGKGKPGDQFVTLSPGVALLLRIRIPEIANNEIKDTGAGVWYRVDSVQAKDMEGWVGYADLEKAPLWFIIHGRSQDYITMNLEAFIFVLNNSGYL